MDLRMRLQRRQIEVDSIREFVAGSDDEEATGAIPDDEITAAIRREFDIPGSLTDARAESTLQEALDMIAAEDMAEADELLAEEFRTVCEVETPSHLDREGLSVSEEEWQGILKLQEQLSKEGLSRETVAQSMDGEGSPDDARVAEEIRSRTGLPDTLSDGEAERIVDQAIQLAIDGRPAAAAGYLNDELAPEHSAACHLTETDQSALIDEVTADD
jgi:hypothetical protein